MHTMVSETPIKNKAKHKIKLPTYSTGEEIMNAVSHGVGSLFGVIATTILLTLSIIYGDALAIVSCAIYGVCLTLLYTMSTLYHSFTSPTVKRVFRIFDHASIYLLIAGTYTPLCLIALRGQMIGIVIVAVVWACAIAGIVMNAISINKTEKIGLALYVIMGWAVVWVIVPIVKALPASAFIMLVLGGIAYTSGIIFYAQKKRKYMHGIWHLFVLTGSVLHFVSVLLVLPMTYK